MTNYNLTYHRFSERAILVQWPPGISEPVLKDVLSFKNRLLDHGIEQIVEVNHAYQSLLVIYHDTIDNLNSTVSALKEQYEQRVAVKKERQQLWKIPVCYHADFGLDLAEISEAKQLPIPELIQRHCQAIYTVYFIGFLPGFLYLGGLDEALHMPRKKRPRAAIKKGAVAIGGSQTGIYPNASPAGWQLIGNCPLRLFDATQNPPCFAKAGDKVQCYEIDLKTHHTISKAVEQGTYHLKSEVFYD